MKAAPQLSVIVPFYNEEENVRPVLEEIRYCLPEAEIVAVNDGSTDQTARELSAFQDIQVIHLDVRSGQSFAFYHGLLAARGGICALLDGDGQLDPSDIPAMVSLLCGHDVVCGYREKRIDPLGKRMGSWIANRVRRMILQDGVIDSGCSLKVFPREHLRHLIPFDGLHRFLPAFFLAGGLTLAQMPVRHRPRRAGNSKYPVSSSFRRGIRGLFDLMGVCWYLSRIKKGNPSRQVP